MTWELPARRPEADRIPLWFVILLHLVLATFMSELGLLAGRALSQ